MVNSIGLANPGLERFAEDDLPRLAELGVPIIASVGRLVAGRVRGGGGPGRRPLGRGRNRAQRVVPNVESGCISIGTDAGDTLVVERCRRTDVQSSPSSPRASPRSRYRDRCRGGWRARLVLINTVRGIAIDRTTLRPLLGGGGGGLSGPAIKPVALHAVYHARAATGLPIIGMGGVAGAADASEFLAAGATLVGIGTALFRDPEVVERASADLLAELRAPGASGPGELVAVAHPPTSTSSRA